jgi:hypothetical protein
MWQLCLTKDVAKVDHGRTISSPGEDVPSRSACISSTPTSEMELLHQLCQTKYFDNLNHGRTISEPSENVPSNPAWYRPTTTSEMRLLEQPCQTKDVEREADLLAQ